MTAEPVAQTPAVSEELERRAVDVIRGLSMDAVQKANSGHPGTPMALAPLAHVLFTRILRYDAADADWPQHGDRPADGSELRHVRRGAEVIR